MRCRKTDLCGPDCRTTTRRRWELRPGGTFYFWSSRLRLGRRVGIPTIRFAGCFFWVCGSTVCTRVASRRVRRARLCEQNSAAYLYRRIFATDADTAWCRALLE